MAHMLVIFVIIIVVDTIVVVIIAIVTGVIIVQYMALNWLKATKTQDVDSQTVLKDTKAHFVSIQ